MVVVDSKDNLQDPNVRTEAISGTNLFGFKDQLDQLEDSGAIKIPATQQSMAITTPQKKEPNVTTTATKRRFAPNIQNSTQSKTVSSNGVSLERASKHIEVKAAQP